MKVFVYGTLRKGENNHELLTEIGATFVCYAELPGYRMWSVGAFPFAAKADPKKKHATSKIFGEVYEVSTEGIDALDWLEGFYGKDQGVYNHYIRETLAVFDADTNEELKVEVYTGGHALKARRISAPIAKPIDHGDWCSRNS